jgi:alpha-N-arabinofuranosidase
LRVEARAPTYATEGEADVPTLEATAVHDGDDTLTVFAVNRGTEPLALRALLRGLRSPEVTEHIVLADDDPAAANTAEQPDRVRPRTVRGARVEDGELRAELRARSWNVLRLTRAG